MLGKAEFQSLVTKGMKKIGAKSPKGTACLGEGSSEINSEKLQLPLKSLPNHRTSKGAKTIKPFLIERFTP